MKASYAVFTGALLLCLALGAGAQDFELVVGGGGPSFGVFMPDIAAISGFVADSGFPALEGDLLLVGGLGRGGLVPGPTFGGSGWGAWITSTQGDLEVELGVGVGGFDLGYAIGGSENAIAAFGLLMGMGGADLKLEGVPGDPIPVPLGILPVPTEHVYNSVFLVLAPYAEFQLDLLDWVGVSLRAGYVWTPISYDWHDAGLPDAPSLALDGVYLSISVVFGGIFEAE